MCLGFILMKVETNCQNLAVFHEIKFIFVLKSYRYCVRVIFESKNYLSGTISQLLSCLPFYVCLLGDRTTSGFGDVVWGPSAILHWHHGF